MQTAEECMLKHVAQRGIQALWLKKALFPPLLLLPPMESCLKKILSSTRHSLDPIKTDHWPGEDTTENEDELGTDGLSPGILQDRYERAVAVDSW